MRGGEPEAGSALSIAHRWVPSCRQHPRHLDRGLQAGTGAGANAFGRIKGFERGTTIRQGLLVETLKDIYYAEKHILKALPGMVKKAGSRP
jgi:hypothetical protein